MSPYASTPRHAVPASAETHASSPPDRSSSRQLVPRESHGTAASRLTAASLALESFWDLGVLDRLHAPLTHYHE
jgi:hypothetical protein